MSWFKKLTSGLSKTSTKITESVTKAVTHKKLDDNTIEALEEALISADLGTKLALEFTAKLAKDRFDAKISQDEIKSELAAHITPILEAVAAPLPAITASPTVILMVGVNGNGKTTTAGKLAAHYKSQGKSVMMAACDTFRAAAIEQLQVWAERVDCECVTGAFESDPASVAFAALERAQATNTDVLLIDTAGRLQTKTTLMEELGKIARVLAKIDAAAPHHTLLVLDATTGQNAHSQIDAFKAAANITGLIITKLDGTAKGGVVVALADKYRLPIHAIGIGEQIEDLQPFNASEFTKSMLASDS